MVLWAGTLGTAFPAWAPLLPKAQAAGATLFLEPGSGSFVAENTFDVAVQVDTGGQAINAVLVDLTFPTDKLQIVRPAQTSSFVSVWIAQPTYSNTDGTIHLQGGAPSPGLTSSAGTILTFTFRARSAGEATVSFVDSSKVFANDGKGTNILATRRSATYTITPKPPEGPTITSPTHPDQNKWYSNRTPQFVWKATPTPQALSWTIDHSPSTQPDTTPEPFAPIIAPTVQEDGVWYFHLRSQTNGVWGGTSHYQVQIDTTPPAHFSPLVQSSRTGPNDLAVANNQTNTLQKTLTPILSDDRAVTSFQTTDATSGIDHYELQVVGLTGKWNLSASFTEEQSPYTLPVLPLGQYQLVVRAADRAGNSADGSSEFEVVNQSKLVGSTFKQLPLWVRWTLGSGGGLLLLIGIFVLVRWLVRRRRPQPFYSPYPTYPPGYQVYLHPPPPQPQPSYIAPAPPSAPAATPAPAQTFPLTATPAPFVAPAASTPPTGGLVARPSPQRFDIAPPQRVFQNQIVAQGGGNGRV